MTLNEEMPEKSRGRKPARGGGRMVDDGQTQKAVSFEPEQMDVDDKFDELTKPMYKGKRIDEAIPSAVVGSLHISTFKNYN